MRVLLVDDDPNVLSGYRRSLRRFEHWDCRFAEGGQAALDVLDAAPADVLVTDMRMPDVDGMAVLRRVRQTYPETVRLAMSGYSEDELRVGTENLAHRYLHKPFPTPDLVELLAELEGAIASIGVRDLRPIVGGLDRLPTPPDLFPELLGALNRSDTPEAVRLIESDIGLASLILRIVNSGFYGVPRTVTSIREAGTLLGVRILSHVVSLWAMGTAMAVPAERVRQLGEHGVAVANHVRATSPDDEAAISAALVSGAGPMVVEAYGLQDDPDRVAAAFLVLWGGPLSVVYAIDGARRPDATGSAKVLRDAREAVGTEVV